MSDDQTTATPSEETPQPRRQRTPEEIAAQREAMMARRAAKAAGQELPPEEPATSAEAPAPSEAEAASAEAPQRKRTPEEIAAQREAMMARRAAKAAGEAPPAAEPVAAAPAKAAPTKAGGKRTPEEIAAQREAMMARRAAKGAKGDAPAKAASAPAAKAAPTAKVAAKKAAAKKAAKKARAAKKAFERPQNITRREFLNWAWLGSIALLTVQTLGVHILFLFPRFKEGQFGGLFPIGQAAAVLPELNAPPKPFNDGKFWLTNTDKGVYAIYTVCTHLGCLYAWADVTGRFECPCHGSKFSLTGNYLDGPAPRSLDRFPIIAKDAAGNEIARSPENGGGIELTGDEFLEIDTGNRISLPGRVEV